MYSFTVFAIYTPAPIQVLSTPYGDQHSVIFLSANTDPFACAESHHDNQRSRSRRRDAFRRQFLPPAPQDPGLACHLAHARTLILIRPTAVHLVVDDSTNRRSGATGPPYRSPKPINLEHCSLYVDASITADKEIPGRRLPCLKLRSG